MNVLRQAGAFVRSRFAGVIQETDEGYRFTYDAAYQSSDGARAAWPGPRPE